MIFNANILYAVSKGESIECKWEMQKCDDMACNVDGFCLIRRIIEWNGTNWWKPIEEISLENECVRIWIRFKYDR